MIKVFIFKSVGYFLSLEGGGMRQIKIHLYTTKSISN